ncbi:DUF3889 domain-containing protein [Neobacillus sp. D3-1R]|uniref:DUF3889 domain-containing protein n=1 Tax=Neobacillus sp. D3-1R TaxID=3445778 RepID=UPI003FA133EA
MKKLQLSFMAFFILVFFGMSQAHAERIDYEKYGKIAIAVVKADYPGEPVTEYQYLGREKITVTDVQDSFQFAVKDEGKQKSVVVKVKHSIQSNKLLQLTVEEMKQ